MWRDEQWKVNNICRDFVELLEKTFSGKWTLRAGGQILKSKQLSIIREICLSLEILTLHGSHKVFIGHDLVNNTIDFVYTRRKEMAEVFQFKLPEEAADSAKGSLKQKIAFVNKVLAR